MKRLLLKYEKKGYAGFLSHRETIRLLDRALRRSGIPIVFTSGYSPRPRMTFSPALPLGVEAEAEYLEVAVEGDIDTAEAGKGLNRALPTGLRVWEVQALPPGMPKLSKWARYGLYTVRDGDGEELLLLPLSGEKQGKLGDALEKMAVFRGGPLEKSDVVRKGLYASRFEVFEEIEGPVFLYDGESGDLKRIEGE
ncbi:MAG: TIGR03936 family radical SAM-associated protein [Actinomycetota bacterium]|nr:TIGR03936 family radical SAM-associated protein [Actinomycetota bacterium]